MLNKSQVKNTFFSEMQQMTFLSVYEDFSIFKTGRTIGDFKYFENRYMYFLGVNIF